MAAIDPASSLLKHLILLRCCGLEEYTKTTQEIKAHGHPANIKMLAEFAQWAKANPFIRR
jgi:hypothetical protein